MKTRTFAIPSSSPAPVRHVRRDRGFTLVELLVVFAIGALLTALVPIAFDKMRESSQYREALRSIVTDLRTARYLAVSESREIRFNIDLQNRAFGIDGGSLHDLPKPLQLNATVAGIELAADSVASIRFLPSGGATGGIIEVRRPSGAGTRFDVDWLSGHALQSPLVQ